MNLNTWRPRVHGMVLLSWLAVASCVWWRALHLVISLSALAWAVFFSLPLLICLPGLWRAKRYTHKWATLCVLPYFVVGITEGVANVSDRPWALTMLGCALLWFFALVAYLRITNDEAQKPAAGNL